MTSVTGGSAQLRLLLFDDGALEDRSDPEAVRMLFPWVGGEEERAVSPIFSVLCFSFARWINSFAISSSNVLFVRSILPLKSGACIAARSPLITTPSGDNKSKNTLCQK